ncbi:hypothetical protein FE810_04400 [Thalassotalea litorea]|uniref:Uncharacterized protein n=1 Tax=Thalassotalea litorea TaxID=2020715 RepID=A0A5R9IMJ7_9GAMM|nr:hypothetical protein [Thalassotalea litorea]TLU66755.1 hypothetical protein FE810_04400 [Thalassotalea litorea]
MKLVTTIPKSYAVPLAMALSLHCLILFLLLPKPVTIIENAQIKPKPVKIDSYLYPPSKTLPQPEVSPHEEAASHANAVPIKRTTKQFKEDRVVENTEGVERVEGFESTDTTETNINTQTDETVNRQTQSRVDTATETETKARKPLGKAVFNPYKGLDTLSSQKDQDNTNNPYQSSRGYSVFQQLPASVPISVVKPTADQIRAQNTTIVGNETIEKRDGYCYQETDLSFINDEFGKSSSFSACGESRKDKYFREFMQQVGERR